METPGAKTVSQITGTVSYRERIALSSTAQLNVQLQDISRADAAATIIAEEDVGDIGQVPIHFTLDYDPAVIDERNTYSVRATIRDKGKMLFTTDTVYPVLTRGSDNNVEINLIRVTPAATQNTAELTDTTWELAAINGSFLSLADGRRAPTLRFLSEGKIVQGFSGCNQFNGTWKIRDGQIELGPMAMTMMACVEGMEAETALMRALDVMDRQERQGNELRMYQGKQELLLFTAVMEP